MTGGGAGDYQLSLSVAGDVDQNGLVDGIDSGLVAGGDPVYDIDGDGVTDSTDRQIVSANFGFVANTAPAVIASLPAQRTHVDLSVRVDPRLLVIDPDGDLLYWRVVASQNGSARVNLDGTVDFTPLGGYAGPASVTLQADDGRSASGPLTIDVVISDAPLVGLDLAERNLRLDVGEAMRLDVIGQFADQRDVALPASYLDLTSEDADVAQFVHGTHLIGNAPGVTLLRYFSVMARRRRTSSWATCLQHAATTRHRFVGNRILGNPCLSARPSHYPPGRLDNCWFP